MAGGARELIDGLAVPFDAEPAQPVENGGHRFGRIALAVGILDAQAKRSAVMLGEEVVEQRRAGAANMEKSCGRGGEANGDWHRLRSACCGLLRKAAV